MYRFLYILLIAGILVGAVFAQTPTPSPTPRPLGDTQAVKPENAVRNIPAVAPTYRSTDRSLPDVSRVGVDPADQLPLTLHDALERALSNNKDIEISRKTERMAEFDVRAARGFYQPRLSGQRNLSRLKGS